MKETRFVNRYELETYKSLCFFFFPRSSSILSGIFTQ